jgi:hypothetical protein
VVRTLAAASLMLLACGSTANACSCIPVAVDDVLARAEIAFRGRVTATRIIDGGRRLTARVAVTEKIKSRVSARMVVTTSNQPGLCGYPMFEGRVYLFAGSRGRDGALAINMCTMIPLNSRRVD